MMLKSVLFVALLAAVYAVSDDKDSEGKYTVTEEAWFEVEVKDLDGPGQVNISYLIICFILNSELLWNLCFTATCYL